MKLSPSQEKAAVAEYGEGDKISVTALAKKFGVPYTTMWRLLAEKYHVVLRLPGRPRKVK